MLQAIFVLQVGDQLMEINGRSTKDMTHADAIELIKQCGSSVSLLVKRGGKLPQHLGKCGLPICLTLSG